MQQTKRALRNVVTYEPTRADARNFVGVRGSRAYAMSSDAPSAIARMVREDAASYSAYESEGSERRTLGSLPVGLDARWTATLTVPIPLRDIAFLQVERRGELPARYRGAEESALLSLPIGEADALIALLTGVVAQARRDGVLPGE
jgi:hypothetical protein